MSSWKDHKAAGNELYSADDFEGAVGKYTAALTSDDIEDADRVAVLCNRAQCRLKLKQYSEAIEDCSAALVFDESNLKALFRRAAAEEALGMKADAVRDYKKVLQLNRTVTLAREGLRRLDPKAPELAARSSGGTALAGKTTREEGGGGSGSGAPMRREPTTEEMKQLAVAEHQIKAVMRQEAQARAKRAASEQELRSIAFQHKYLESVDDTQRTFRAVGRGFIQLPRDELVSQLEEAATKHGKALEVSKTTLEYLAKKRTEADEGFVDAYNSIRAAMGLPLAAREAFAESAPDAAAAAAAPAPSTAVAASAVPEESGKEEE